MFGLSSLATKLILGSIAVAALFAGAVYIRHVIAENGALQGQLDEAVATNQKSLQAFDDYKAHQDQVLKALAGQHASDQARLAGAAKLKQEIAHAKPADDGPVAAVLARTLDGLRNVNGMRPGAPANATPH